MIMIVKTPVSQMGSPAAAEEGGEEMGTVGGGGNPSLVTNMPSGVVHGPFDSASAPLSSSRPRRSAPLPCSCCRLSGCRLNLNFLFACGQAGFGKPDSKIEGCE